MHLTEINIYPVKSLGGISLTAAAVERRGLRHDRRWMLVDDTGRFISQREIPRMALLDTAIEPPYLVVYERGNPASRTQVPLDPTEQDFAPLPKKMVEVWSARCAARLMSEEASHWFSEVLGRDMQLVWMPPTTHRPTRWRRTGRSL
ncbi:MAG TPA: MOSC domain-containing protein, partial [Saprospiraceae bacterium]|nr:MOSC domain-containing protein [Saprospiraceae bacterium]